MKILPYSTHSFAQNRSLLGAHVQPSELAKLEGAPHGFVIVGFADERGIQNVGGRVGAAAAPAALRQKLYKFTTGAPAKPIYDIGDLLPSGSLEDTHDAGARITRRLHEIGHVPVVVGGGHDLGYPHALGLLDFRRGKRLAFVNIDAHLDVRSTENGITSGSPWYLLREHPLFATSGSRIEEFGLQPHCNSEPLVQYARKHKFGLHWLEEIRKNKKTADFAFAALLKKLGGHDGILVSFDIDSVQWSDAPGCSAPQTLGFTAAEAVQMSLLAGQNKKVKSFGLFELSPPLDPDGRTAALAAHCINAFLRGKGAWKK